MPISPCEVAGAACTPEEFKPARWRVGTGKGAGLRKAETISYTVFTLPASPFPSPAAAPPPHPRLRPRPGNTTTGAPGTYNYLIDAVLAVPRTRQMYVRRLRSLMDQLIATGRLQVGLWALQTAGTLQLSSLSCTAAASQPALQRVSNKAAVLWQALARSPAGGPRALCWGPGAGSWRRQGPRASKG